MGAAIRLGLAGSLGVGALLVAADVNWRLTFVVSTAGALSVLPIPRGHGDLSYEPGEGGTLNLHTGSASDQGPGSSANPAGDG